MNYSKQCTLTKGTKSQVAWIPEEFAKLNKFVRLFEEDGWQVMTVGATRVSTDYLLTHEREYLNHRKVTDV